MRKTKIVCTIGPASSSEDRIRDLMNKGMDVARLNFSHGNHPGYKVLIEKIRKTSQQLGKPTAILQDLEGPRLRVGQIEQGSIQLNPLAPLTLTCTQTMGNEQEVSVSYPELAKVVQPGDPILLSDGAVELRVEKISGQNIYCSVVSGGSLTSFKGINLPTRKINIPAFTPKDRVDLEFGIREGVDYVALSFVSSPNDIEAAKDFLRSQNVDTPVIAKIERQEALRHLDEILKAADGIMVARGDLGVEIPLEKIPVLQKQMIRKANAFGKPVITATQMLHSMIENPRPTRAEATDVANAIFDGTDAVMLSEETAVGKYPVEAVMKMGQIMVEAEAYPGAIASTSWGSGEKQTEKAFITDTACEAATQAAEGIRAKAIVVFTHSGNTARLVAKYRPKVPILAFTPFDFVRRRMALFWGVRPKQMETVDSPTRLLSFLQKHLIEEGYQQGDHFVVLFGFPIDKKGPTNMIKLHTIE